MKMCSVTHHVQVNIALMFRERPTPIPRCLIHGPDKTHEYTVPQCHIAAAGNCCAQGMRSVLVGPPTRN
jgi:hypothetical protein